MKAFNTLVLSKTLGAAAIATSGLAAPALSHASPDDGMACRANYSAQFAGGNIKCTRPVQRFVSLECTNPGFPSKLIRAAGIQGDTTGGRDMCLRNGIVLGSNQPATGLRAGQDFVFVAINQAKVVAAREAVERLEERSLGLDTDGVDSRSTGTLDINGGIGAEDRVRVAVTLFTFPVAAANRLLSPLQIDAPILDLDARRLP
jgi:hypothetical protein